MARTGGKRMAWWAWPGLLLGALLAGPAGAAPLDDWRAEAKAVRELAENDTAQAAAHAAHLAAALPATAPPADRARLLNLQARIALYRAETERAGALAEQALALAERSGDRVGQAEADLVISLNTVNQGKFDRLFAVTSHALKVLEGVDRPELLAEAMLRLAMTYTRFGKLEESIDACLRTLDLARRSGNPMAMAFGHQCVASSFNSSDNYVESLEHYRKMEVQARAANSRLLQALALSGQGGVIASQGDVKRGEAMIAQASALYRSIGLPFYLTAALYAEASQARLQGDRARAIALLDEAERTYRRLPNKTGLWWTLTARAADYAELNKLGAAEQDLQQALAIARDLNLPLYLSETERQLGQIDARRGDFKRAYQHSLSAAEMVAQANRKKISTRVLELAERYQQEARQREIAELTRRNEQQQAELRERALQQRWLWTVLGAIVLGLAVLAFFLLRLRRSHRLLAAANSGLHQSQEALQRQTGILQSVLDSMGDGVVVTDQHGRLVLANPAAERIVGIVRDGHGMAWPSGRHFCQMDRRTVVPEQDMPLARALRRASAQPAAGGEADAHAEIFMSGAGLPDGGRWLDMTARPLAGEQAGAVAVISDITERKHAEEKIRALNANLESMVQQRTAQLRQQTRYLRVLIDTIPWWVWFKDTDSRYLAVNRATAAILGTAVEEMVGKTDYDVKPAEVARAFREDDLKVMSSRRPQTVEEVQQGPQGPLWVEIFKTPVTDEDGTVLGTVGLARDISVRKQTEAARDAALLEAQRLAGMRSDFLAQMSHELRTPLNAVLGFVQLLLRDGGLSERQLSSVKSIGYSGEHLLGLINDVLDSAKLEASKLQLFPQQVAMAGLLDGIAAMIRIKAAEQGLDFACEVGPGVPGLLLVDEQRLRQVLLNLLSNAIKFTDRGAVRLKVTASAPGRLRFAVQDSGVGIEPGQLETIFQPFEQVGEAQRRFGGTGLGLAISRQLVRLMGSEIQVESQPGVGSLFWFELALAGAAAAAPAVPPAAPAAAPEQALPVPPLGEVEALLQLVRIGNMRAILAHADHLEALDTAYLPLAEQLRRLARGYQSKALRSLAEGLLQGADAA
jgi:PAS domain S-box-containing protein